MQIASRIVAVLALIFVTAKAYGQYTFQATSHFACGTCRCGPQQNIESFSPIVSRGMFSDPTSVARYFTVAERGLIICRRVGNAWDQICIGFGGSARITANDLVFSGPQGATSVANVSWRAHVATEFVATGGGSQGGGLVQGSVGGGGALSINSGDTQSFQSYANSSLLTSAIGTRALDVAHIFHLTVGVFTLTPYYGIDCVGMGMLHFPVGEPVFNLPPGYTVNSATLNIVNNFWMGTEKYPFVMGQPSAADACAGAEASFNVLATGESLQYQWRRDGINLSDGPTGSGSSIAGANAATLQIVGVSASDQAFDDVVVSNEFGDESSDPAALSLINIGCNVAPTCSVDVGLNVADADGRYIATVGEAFFVVFIGSDDDANDTLTVGGALPVGAAMTPPAGESASAPLPAIFSWTPDDGDVAGSPHTIEVSFADIAGESSTCSMQIVVIPSPDGAMLEAVGPAPVWIGLKNSDDVGIRFDLMCKVYLNGSLVGTGNLNSVAGGSSGFNNAKLNSIPLTLNSPVEVLPGDVLSFELYERNASSGSGKNSGTVRLWFNDAAANSHVDITISGATSSHSLIDGFILGEAPGTGPKKTIDKPAGAKGSPFKLFGTWSTTVQ